MRLVVSKMILRELWTYGRTVGKALRPRVWDFILAGTANGEKLLLVVKALGFHV